MACGCGARAKAAAAGMEILGYRITFPDGSVYPTNGVFLTKAEALAEIRDRGEGTAVQVTTKKQS